MMMATIKDHLVKSFHRVIFAAYLFTIYYDYKYIIAPAGSKADIERKQLGGRFKFLTFLNAIIVQTTFFGLSTINDIVGRKGKKPSVLQRFNDWFFTTVAFPVGCFVTVSFWGIFLANRELIMPESYDTWYPQWFSHLYHTMPFVSLFLEAVIVEHQYPKGLFARWGPLVVVYSMYTAWVYYVHNIGKFWIYPVFDVLDDFQRALFFILLTIPFIVLSFVGEKLTKIVWRKASASKKSSAKSNDNNKAKGSPKKKKASTPKNSPKKNAQTPTKNTPKKNAQPEAKNTPKKAPKSAANGNPKKVQSPKGKNKRD